MIHANKYPNIYFALFYLTGTIISILGIGSTLFKTYAEHESAKYYTYTTFEPETFIGFLILYCLSQFGYLESILTSKMSPNKMAK